MEANQYIKDQLNSISKIEIIDAHLHYGTGPVISDSLITPNLRYDHPQSVIDVMDQFGISRAILLPPDRVLNPPKDITFNEPSVPV